MASVGISEVARLAGVSTATVSRALSGRGAVSAATKQRVEIAAAELDYVPLPESVVQQVQGAWKSEIKAADGAAVWQ